MNELAVCILSFKRPDYLKKCLRSFESCAKLDEVDVWLCQDGAACPWSGKDYARKEDIEASIKTFEKSKLLNKMVHRQPYNVGPAEQVCWAFGNLFYEGYKFVGVMGDDSIVNRWYVKTLLTLSRQFREHPKAGILRTGPSSFPGRTGHVQSYEEAKAVENVVDFCDGERGVDMGIWHRAWTLISPMMDEYCKMLKQVDFRKLIECKWHGTHREIQPVVAAMEERFGSIHEDLVPELAAKKAGMEVMRTLAPRCIPIGLEGSLDRLPSFYYRLGFDRYQLHDIGDVDRYYFPGQEPDVPPRMAYRGRDGQPFSIRGQPSGKTYWRVQKDVPFDVIPADVPFLETKGFERL